jgi:TRAP-type uncharacterized transport system fused permease subunit
VTAASQAVPDPRGEGSLVARLLFWGGVGIPAWHLWLNSFGVMSELRVSVVHFAMFAAFGALAWPMLKGGGARGASPSRSTSRPATSRSARQPTCSSAR